MDIIGRSYILITSGISRVKTKQYTYKRRKEASHLEQQGRLVQRADNAIQQINRFPGNDCHQNVLPYLHHRDLSSR